MMFLRPRSLASTLSVLTHRPTFAMATATVACQRSGVAGASGSGLRCRGVGGAFSSSARALCSSSSSSSSSLATVPQPTKRQLLMLALAGGVPFIGFGFADNFIMIIAGDQIDATLGIRFGLSTLAAAGLGNLISDVIGLSLQDVIESKTSRFFKAPPLTEVQLELPRTRFVKVSANSIGISIGCLLGMVPLLFMHDRKTIYFDDDEMSLYHSQFAPYGVSPQQFFELLHHGKWRTADAGTPMVTKGDILHSVFFLHSGSAQAVARDDKGHETLVALYNGTDQDVAMLPSHVARGCIIGGTALVDGTLAGRPYPNTVTLNQRTKYLEWNTEELRKVMREDKSIEAAVLSTLYVDLIRGKRAQKSLALREDEETRASLRHEYELVLRAVLADGLVHPLEKAMLSDYAAKHHVSESDLNELLASQGWSRREFDSGLKDNLKMTRVQPQAATTTATAIAATAAASAATTAAAAAAAATVTPTPVGAIPRHLNLHPGGEDPGQQPPATSSEEAARAPR
jgi:CRP-like cAMP-binding protein